MGCLRWTQATGPARVDSRLPSKDRLSVELATDQYKQGLVDFVTVLDTQRELLSAQDALARSEQEASTTLVALYKALCGGGEEDRPGKN